MTTLPEQIQFSKLILIWYDKYGRKNLPWRKNISAYRIWLSEIMLQQTQANTVIPYFEKFINHFPNIAELAKAEEDDVLKLWAGLGYYTRARNLHKTARIIDQQYQNKFPSTVIELEKLPGVGRSTAGAVVAIAFNKKAAILDGNVKRVLARFEAIEGWPGKTSINQKLWRLAEQHLPQERFDDYTQAIMDLCEYKLLRLNP